VSDDELKAIFIEQLVLTRKSIDAALRVFLGEDVQEPEVTSCPECGSPPEIWAVVEGTIEDSWMCQKCNTFFKANHGEKENPGTSDQHPSLPVAS